jgi:hypothetical protein
MRKELKEFNWHVYGLNCSDLDYTIGLIDEIISDRQGQLKVKTDSIECYDESGKLVDISTGIGDEAIDDIHYYNYIENLFLWHFALWRLQGIFEGILKQEFFPDKNLMGLLAKMQFVRELGFTIDEGDFQELVNWGKLRNALSHFPPEQYRPIEINQNDLVEYSDLVKKVIRGLLREKALADGK